MFPNSPQTNVNDSAVFVIFVAGRLGFAKSGARSLAFVDDNSFEYDDIIVYKGQFYKKTIKSKRQSNDTLWQNYMVQIKVAMNRETRQVTNTSINKYCKHDNYIDMQLSILTISKPLQSKRNIHRCRGQGKQPPPWIRAPRHALRPV